MKRDRFGHEVQCDAGEASPEAQVKFLMTLNKVRLDEIASLNLEIERLRSENSLAWKEANKGCDEHYIQIVRLEREVSNLERRLAKKTWWNFWSSDGT